MESRKREKNDTTESLKNREGVAERQDYGKKEWTRVRTYVFGGAGDGQTEQLVTLESWPSEANERLVRGTEKIIHDYFFYFRTSLLGILSLSLSLSPSTDVSKAGERYERIDTGKNRTGDTLHRLLPGADSVATRSPNWKSPNR